MPQEQFWTVKRRGQNVPETFLQSMPDLHPILAKVLYARGLESRQEIDAFLSAEESEGDVFSLPDMAAAVERILRAIAEKEPIVVYGDFDVDGTTASALLVTALTRLGATVDYYIPDRFLESYGLNTEALAKLYDEGARLIVTVDCGIRSVKEVVYANELGLDMVLTDHHSVPEVLPPALAVIDPKREDSAYPFSELSGVGVAFRLAQALYRQAGLDASEADELIDLVALGTVADVVPLTGENRRLAARGLRRMATTQRHGLTQLMRVADVDPRHVSSYSVGFRLGPRINAAGRLEHASLAYRLLTTDDEAEALALATELDQLNTRRQEMLQEGVRLAEEQLTDVTGQKILFVGDESFSEGLVGLVAGRLADRYHRPALVMRQEAESSRGSARSIEGFHITHALDTCADLLDRYGGHEQAAGFSLETRLVPEFQRRMAAYAEEHLTEQLLRRRFAVDTLVGLAELDDSVPAALARLEPCGEGNPAPSLAALGLNLDGLRAVGSDNQHLQLTVSSDGRHLRGIAFRQGHLATTLRLGQKVDIIFRPQWNEWNGQRSLQLVVDALRTSRS